MRIFLYHRAGLGKYANPPALLEEHFCWLKQNFQILLPGQKIQHFTKAICLTFDDATHDFYYDVFPLLQKLNIQVLLAVPVQSIVECSSGPETLFCSWNELKEMIASGFVHIASHSMSHSDLVMPGIDLNYEIVESKKILEDRLGVPINTFIYPFGRFNRKVHRIARENYEFVMRIGNALNIGWKNWNGMTYRIPSDNLTHIKQNFSLRRTISFYLFYLLNSLRSR